MIKRTIESANVPVKIWTDDVDENSIEQLRKTASLPFVFHHVAAMPDVHLGIGATVGSVVATKGAVCPAAVGVDIGCGMMAQKTTLREDFFSSAQLATLRHSIERAVPVGFNDHSTPLERVAYQGWRHDTPFMASGNMLKKAEHQVGTLGGGNHFIEVSRDTDGWLWVVLHSGSRGLGNKVAQIHVDKAKGLMREVLDDPNLAHFVAESPEFAQYVHDVESCQEYAMDNRRAMMDLVLGEVAYLANGDKFTDAIVVGPAINCHHNYLARETHYGEQVIVTRKGAIRAQVGDLGIIPGSMGARSFIVRGLGNPESFNSAPHGAGRRMSRTRAKKEFTVEDLAVQTAGVECRKDKDVVDEIPGAYKDIGVVMANSADLVEIVAELKQLLCVKG